MTTSDSNILVNFCDYDRNWGFLLFLRPERHQAIGVVRAFAAAVLLGMPLGLLGSIVVSLIAKEVEKPAPALMVFPSVLIAVYFIAAQVTLVRAWNERAKRLAALQRRDSV